MKTNIYYYHMNNYNIKHHSQKRQSQCYRFLKTTKITNIFKDEKDSQIHIINSLEIKTKSLEEKLLHQAEEKIVAQEVIQNFETLLSEAQVLLRTLQRGINKYFASKSTKNDLILRRNW